MLIDLSVLAGAFVQELVSPFPSFLVFVPGGAALRTQGASLWHLVLLALIVGLVRVLAGLILYRLSSWLHGQIFAKRTSLLGITKQRLAHTQRTFSKQGGWWAIFTSWALPVIPGTLISLTAGFLKIPVGVFISATYAGSIINALTYLLIGYYGLQTALSIL